MVDVANFAMFAWNQEPDAPPDEPEEPDASE